MLLDDPFEALAPRYLLLCLNVLGSHHANEDLEEFEANQGAVIIAVLIIFFIVCGCKSDVQDLRSKSLIVELCLRAEMMELRLANVGWITAFCNDLQKYFFEVMEVPFDNLFARNNLLLVFDYLIELPVPKVMLKAVFISYLSVLFPVAKHWSLLAEDLRSRKLLLEYLRDLWESLLSDLHDVSTVKVLTLLRLLSFSFLNYFNLLLTLGIVSDKHVSAPRLDENR